MNALISLYNAPFDRLNALAGTLVPTLARLVFILVLFYYFWKSAGTKIEGSIFSPSSVAIGKIFPKAAEAVFWDVSQLTFIQRIVIFLGTVAEFVLPVLIAVGLFTRLAALGMIGFILVQTTVDVTGHGAALGAWLDNAPQLIDQRTLWIFLFLVLLFKGAGPLSLDRLLKLN